MESLVSLSCSESAVCAFPSNTASIWQDILAQAVTGELMAAMNYTALSTICDDPEEVADALEHAQGEHGHAAAFAAEGRKIGVSVPDNVNAKYWKRIRESFMRCIAERDFIACLIVQEIMLESFAVASYTRVGKAAVERQRATVRGKSVIVTPQHAIEISEIKMRLRIARLQCQRFAETRQRIVKALQFGKHRTALIDGNDMIWRQRQHAVELLDRCVEPFEFVERDGADIQKRHKARI